MVENKDLRLFEVGPGQASFTDDGAIARLNFLMPDGSPVALLMRRRALEMTDESIQTALAGTPSPIRRA